MFPQSALGETPGGQSRSSRPISYSDRRRSYLSAVRFYSRVMYDSLSGRPPIAAGRLVGTREAWMLRYAPLLSPDEFTKFATLTKDLSPFVVVLLAPESRSRRLDR